MSVLLHPQPLYPKQTFKNFLIISQGEVREFPIRTSVTVLASLPTTLINKKEKYKRWNF